jgi:protein-tyrosine-phosphatase
MKKVLFLCTGNSCRSQMAEGFARTVAQPGIEIYSAGVARAEGSEAAILEAFRSVRDELQGRVRSLLGRG